MNRYLATAAVAACASGWLAGGAAPVAQDGHFVISANRVYTVGGLNDAEGWVHLDNEAKNVRPVAGSAEINVDEIKNTGATYDVWDRSVSAFGVRPLSPDNRYHNVTGLFGINLPKDRFTATAAYGRLDQNQGLLPYSYNNDRLAVQTCGAHRVRGLPLSLLTPRAAGGGALTLEPQRPAPRAAFGRPRRSPTSRTTCRDAAGSTSAAAWALAAGALQRPARSHGVGAATRLVRPIAVSNPAAACTSVRQPRQMVRPGACDALSCGSPE